MNDEALQYREYYNRYGSKYFELRTIHGGLIFNEYIEIPTILKILDNYVPLNVHDALDIGCAFGFYSKKIASVSSQVTSIDVSDRMIEIAKKYCSDFSNISFYNTDFLSFDSKGLKFQLVLACFMLGYFDDLKLFFKKISGMVSENSVIITSMLHPIVQSKLSKTLTGYVIEDYFCNGKFETDFISDEHPVILNRWSYPDVLLACKENRLYVEQVFEPKPMDDIGLDSAKKAFYSKVPSVSIFLIRPL